MNIPTSPENNSKERNVGEVAAALKGLLRGYDHIAYVVGVHQPRTVRSWAENGIMPADSHMKIRLEVAEVLASTVQDPDRPWVSAAWLISNNPYLEEQSPSDMIQALQDSESDMVTINRLQFAADRFADYE